MSAPLTMPSQFYGWLQPKQDEMYVVDFAIFRLHSWDEGDLLSSSFELLSVGGCMSQVPVVCPHGAWRSYVRGGHHRAHHLRDAFRVPQPVPYQH